jgi:hypothetical protein
MQQCRPAAVKSWNWSLLKIKQLAEEGDSGNAERRMFLWTDSLRGIGRTF